jgi:hypothetical protein
MLTGVLLAACAMLLCCSAALLYRSLREGRRS